MLEINEKNNQYRRVDIFNIKYNQQQGDNIQKKYIFFVFS